MITTTRIPVTTTYSTEHNECILILADGRAAYSPPDTEEELHDSLEALRPFIVGKQLREDAQLADWLAQGLKTPSLAELINHVLDHLLIDTDSQLSAGAFPWDLPGAYQWVDISDGERRAVVRPLPALHALEALAESAEASEADVWDVLLSQKSEAWQYYGGIFPCLCSHGVPVEAIERLIEDGVSVDVMERSWAKGGFGALYRYDNGEYVRMANRNEAVDSANAPNGVIAVGVNRCYVISIP